MNKIDRSEVKVFYFGKNVVSTYDERRFRGYGGKYISNNEVDPIITLIKGLHLEKPSVRILDIGAGRGRLSSEIARFGYKIYCLDSSPDMVDVLRKKIVGCNVFLQSVFDKIPITVKFDVITSLRFLDHFDLRDQKKILRNILFNLKEGGFLVYTSLNKTSLESVISNYLPYGKYNYYYPLKEYKKLFSYCGLEAISEKGSFFLPRGMFIYFQYIPVISHALMLIDFLLSKIFPRFCAYKVYLLKKVGPIKNGILFSIGTRPEAIKVAPVVQQFKKNIYYNR